MNVALKTGQRRLIVLAAVLILFLAASYAGYFSLTVSAAAAFPEGSSIGGVDVSGLSEEEALEQLASSVEIWKKENVNVITSRGVVTIPEEEITFDIKGSVEELKKQVKKPWYMIFRKTEPQQIPFKINVELSEETLAGFPDSVNINETVQRIKQTVSLLGDHDVMALQSEEAEERVIAESSWRIPDDFVFIEMIVDQLDGTVIQPEETFSFLDAVFAPLHTYSEEEGNFAASQLYSLFLQTNLEIIERHSQGVIPVYSVAGIEAKVDWQEEKDLIVNNPGPDHFKIQAEIKSGRLNLQLVSTVQEKNYEYRVIRGTEVDYRTIVRYDENLEPSERRVIQEGEKGKQVEVYRVVVERNGLEKEQEFISRDFYLPVPEIVLVGPQEEETEEPDENSAGLPEEQYFDEDETEGAAGLETDIMPDVEEQQLKKNIKENRSGRNQNTGGNINHTDGKRNVQAKEASMQEPQADDSIYEQPRIVK